MTYHSHPGSTVPSVVIPRRSFAMESAYDAEKKTITAVVATYSIDSARPVTKPPHGPIAAHPNQNAPPPQSPPNATPPSHPEKPPETPAAPTGPRGPPPPVARKSRRFSK